jgi:hypothetical protein
VTFTSPLHKIYFGVSHFSRSRKPPPTKGTLRDFVIASIAMMDPCVLKYTEALSAEQTILERLWQMEGFRAGSIVVPAGSYMSPDVGWVSGSRGELTIEELHFYDRCLLFISCQIILPFAS